MKIKILLFWTVVIGSIVGWLGYVVFFSFYMDSWFTGITLGSLISIGLWAAFYGLIMLFLTETKMWIKLLALIFYGIPILLIKTNIYYAGRAAIGAAFFIGVYELAQDMGKRGVEMNMKKHFTKANLVIYLSLSMAIGVSLFVWVLLKFRQWDMAFYSTFLGYIIAAFYWPAYAMYLYAKATYKSITEQG